MHPTRCRCFLEGLNQRDVLQSSQAEDEWEQIQQKHGNRAWISSTGGCQEEGTNSFGKLGYRKAEERGT